MTAFPVLRCALVVAVVLAAILEFPQSAAGAQPPAKGQLWAKGTTPVRAAAIVARRYWAAVPCKGQIKVLTKRPRPSGLGPASAAWVTFKSSLGPGNVDAPPSSYSDCVITFARWRWPTSTSMRQDWDLFCATMTHELGHLLGHSHNLAPASIMTPAFTDLSSVPTICRATRPIRSADSPHRDR